MKPSPCQHNSKMLEDLECELRQKELIHRRDIQGWLNTAHKTRNVSIYEFVIKRLTVALESENINSMRTYDPFRPHCPASLSKSGALHLIDQMDKLPIYCNPNKLVTGLGIFGPQGSGKSRLIVSLCQQIIRTEPSVNILIIDPKGAFSSLKSFQHIDALDTSFDLTPPSSIRLNVFIHELMPQLAHTAGLIYGLDLLRQAAEIALKQHQECVSKTGNNTGICLKDIHEALRQIKVSSFRKTGYHDAAVTALSLILGGHNLFACRKGISLDWLFKHNVVLNARSLTDDMECRFLAILLLYWIYQNSRYSPETTQLRNLIIIDDATRFVGTSSNQFGGDGISQLGHILAVLRSTGACLIYATQLPAQIDSSVLSLTRNAMVIGNINGENHLKVIQNIMSLSNEQKAAIPQFKTRETIAFLSGHDWKYPLHGWTPHIELSDYTAPNPQKPCLEISPWHSLTDLPVSPRPASPNDQNSSVESKLNSLADSPNVRAKITSNSGKLVLDCIHYPFDKVRTRTKRLQFSARLYESVKTEALQNKFLIASSSGKTVYLIATKKAYEDIGFPWPYARSKSIEHSFYVNLTEHVLKQKTSLKIQKETPIGTKGATIDVTTTDQSGVMTAYEITLSTSNLSSNAAKLQDTAYRKIVWLCRDAKIAKAVQAYFNKSASMPPELVSKFEYVHFSKWIIQNGGLKQ